MTVDECKSMCKTAGIEYKSGYEERVLRYTCSDDSVDRMGDVIKQDGWELDNFKKNPVIMANHDYSKFPVGNAIKVGVQDNKLKMDILFPDDEVSPDSDQAFKLAKSGIMRAGSVGFVPLKHHLMTEDEKENYGVKSDWSFIFEEQELLEFSVCGVPANANAIQESISKGLFRKKDLKKFIPEAMYKELKEDVNEPANKQAGSGTTSEDNDHTHEFEVDDDGNGTAKEANGHTHEIKDFKLQEKDGHTHTINIKGKYNDGKKKPGSKKDSSDLDSLSMFGDTFKALIEKEIDARLEKKIEEKQGAVLSKKNKAMINEAIEGMEKAVEALKSLVASADPVKEDDEDPEENKSTKSDSTFEIDLDTLEDTDEDGLYSGETVFELELD